DLTEQDSPLASLGLSFVPLGVTLLWAVTLWLGARLCLRGATAAGKRLDATESLFLGLRSVLSAVLGSVLLAWAAGTSVTRPSDASASSLAPLLDLPDVTLSVTCSPLRAAWWTLVLASVVLFPTLCRTTMSAWAARRPGLGDWLRAGRLAGVALAVPLSLASLAGVVFLVSEGGFSALVPAVLLAPNLGATLLALGSGASVDFTDTLVITDTSSSGPGGDGSGTAVSLFDLHALGGWVWVSVLLGVVAAVVLGAGVLREAARPATAVRALVCFVAGFLLSAVTAGVTVELSSSFSESSRLAYLFAASLKMSPTDGSALAVGPAVPTVLLAATVWAALGAFGVPAMARRLGITRIEDAPGFSALRRRPSGRPGPVPTAVAAAPVPGTVSVPVPAVAPVAAAMPLAPPVVPQVPDVVPADADPQADDAATPPAEDHPAEEAAAEVSPAPTATPPAPPEPGPAAGLLKPPAPAHPGARFQAAPAGGAENHAAAFANLPTGHMTPPGVVHQAVHAPVPQVVHAPVPRPGQRKIGWGVVTVTLVASAVLAGGVTAAGVWLTSHRSASPSHTTRATDDAVVPGPGAPSPSSTPAPAPADPSTEPSGPDVSPSASRLSPEDIITQVQSMLEESIPQRSRVKSAITAGSSCSYGTKPVKDAHDALREVAVERDDLARRVDLLTPQADGDLAEALGDLSRAWRESAEADRDYATWVSETIGFIDEDGVMGCGFGETRGKEDLPTTHGDEATKAKQSFVALWNPIAMQHSLTPIAFDDI
ncbi:hypothetical protein CW362_39165, partial [Streptomyces populi]